MQINEVIMISIFILAIGACIGSFLNVVALRAISKESIVFPSSKCPLCSTPIKWYDNIPVISYFFTIRGKCRNCGGKVSVQYPIVELLTAVLFFTVFFAYGFTIKTLLILILISLSIVITITDIKKNEIYNVHNWSLIVMSIITGLYFKGIQNYYEVAIGLIAGVFVMEAIARLSYYLIKKPKSSDETLNNEDTNNISCTSESQEQNSQTSDKKEEDEDVDIKKYIESNKRAFGEGDTYLAAAAGALLGWQYLLVAIALAIIFQAVCILPKFIISLYEQKKYRLLTSLTLFMAIAILYWILSNIFTLNLFVVFAIIIALFYFGIDIISELKKTNNTQEYKAIPFGPALLFATFLIFFFGEYIVNLLEQYIFMV